MFFGLATAQQIFGTTDAKSELFDKGTAFGGQTLAGLNYLHRIDDSILH